MIDLGKNKKASHDRGEAPSFGEIVGQEELKRGLLAVAANDDLDGLLVRGEKGTAKSTAVRGLADLLPTQVVVEGCPYGCPPDDPGRQCGACRDRSRADLTAVERPVPLVTLPLSATRERVVGTLSVADALAGDYEFDPGLLARANRGILYVDEVNLLEDHLVDTLLDAAASGVNRVERDGVSVDHPAKFTLVGTMNPEEGDLRPQLRDRFALQATVEGCRAIEDRVAIIDRAIGSAKDTADQKHPNDRDDRSDTADRTAEYRDRLQRARRRLADVSLPRSFRQEIAELCRDAGVEGHRGDIATARAARTFAALDDRGRVIESDVRRAASFALPHRLRSRPFEEAPDPEDLIDDHFDSDGSESNSEERTEEETEDAGKTERDEKDEGNGERAENRTEEPDTGKDGTDRDERAGGQDRVDEDRNGENRTDEDERGVGSSNEPLDGASETDPDRTIEKTTADESGTDDPGEGRVDDPDGDGQGSDDRESEESGASSERQPVGEEGRGDGVEDRPDQTPIVPGESRSGIEPGSASDLPIPEPIDGGPSDGSGSGSRTRSEVGGSDSGPRIRSEPTKSSRASDIDVGASLRAATQRGSGAIESRDLRRSVRRGNAAALVVFAVDASASMRPAMRAAKGTALELLKDAYQHRDEVAVVAFAGTDADVLVPPTDSVELAARHLKDIPTGDRTPLPAGLRTVGDVLHRAEPAASVVVIVTDGRTNVADGSPSAETRDAARELAATDTHVVVVDAGRNDRDRDRSSLTDVIVAETLAERIPLPALSADRIDAAVGSVHEG
ncbi:VWA domain-containing protein [Halopenitus sp. H-Gu1]|uniref:VWA domain-containing protein n=1 Tax=Halopenitus sp. H-Gu1 TaxID=3242697 RepID=UPI00359D4887